MKWITSALALLFGLFSSGCQTRSDVRFLPAEPKASVSFPGVTQSGTQVHRLEVRRLAYSTAENKKLLPAFGADAYYVIYFAGPGYGPQILGPIENGIDPLLRMAGPDAVEIFYLAGAHTHVRERWRLLGYTAKKELSEEINPEDDPRTGQQSKLTASKASQTVVLADSVRASTIELISNYLAGSKPNETATVVLDWTLSEFGNRRAYWVEEKALLTFPDGFAKEAIEAPEMVVRAIRYPDDVRKEGDKELATSTYLEEENWFRARVFETLTRGETLKLNASDLGPKNSAVRISGQP